MIKLYSTKFCPYCVSLRAFLEQKNIDFKEVDVSEDQVAQDEMIKKSGQMTVPVIEIDGEVIVGFDREKICKILKINK
ncbi:MAG: glutathione S-transferase N-terminal domain-containing protein [Candidatus Nealsonbacteria bacterium]|nr:glutathione S-transferase N-terminal domain-containing protein [Candidatus Nealsonbacteria bacterium]